MAFDKPSAGSSARIIWRACRPGLILFAVLLLHAPVPGRAQHLPFRRLTVQNGLASNGVSAMVQSPGGSMIIGTGEGLTVFDGTTCARYGVGEGLAVNNVTCLAESHTVPGGIWVGTFGGGLSLFRDGTFSSVLTDTTSPARYIYAIAEDSRGTVWCATGGGLFRYADGSACRVREWGELGTCLLATRDSMLWVSHPGGVLRVNPVTHAVDPLTIPGGAVTALREDRFGSVWVGTARGLLLRWQAGSEVERRTLPGGRILAVVDDADSTLWVASERGLYGIRPEACGGSRWPVLKEVRGLPSPYLSDLALDFEDNLWVGTRDRGIALLTEKYLVTFPLDNDRGSYNNSRCAVDRAGHLWVASAAKLEEFIRDRGGIWNRYEHTLPRGREGGATPVVQIDRAGRLWLELGDGIGCYRIRARGSRPSALTPLRYLEDGKELPRGGRLFFLIDTRDHLWISVLGAGVYHLDHIRARGIGEYYGAPQDLASNDVRAMLEDRDGSIWLGGVQGGITVVRDPHGASPSIVRYGIQDGLSDDGIRAFAEDAEGKIWVGTRVGGLGVFQHGGFRNLTTADGLQAQTVWSLAYDPGQDIVWAGTSVGVEPVEAQTLRPLPPSGHLRGSGVTGVGLLAPGSLWSASADGLALYEYARERFTTTPPPVFVAGVTVQGEDVPVAVAGEFSSMQRSIRFEFHGITFRDPAGLRFSYRLVGLNHAWSNLTPQTSIAYASLPPGAYRFEVRATTSEGVTSPVPATYSFQISSPLWQRTWFLGFSLASLAAAGSIAARLRIRGVRKQQHLQQEFSRSLLLSQEQERSRIARELHDSLVQLLIVMKNRALVGLRVAENGASRELEEISSTASGAIEEVRRIAHNLRPYQLDRLGLTLAVEGLIRTMNETSGVRFAADIDDLDACFSPEERILLFRIVQEAITNILKHAAATEAEVRIVRRAYEARILVRDNGKGVEAEHGFGLRGIEERATMLGGHLQVQTSAGAGTTILVTIPCKGER